MPRKAPEIKLSDAERVHLEKLSRSHSAERRRVERATILLACAEGKQNQQIANELGVSTVRVGKWRSRFALQGLSGLNDEPRPGKPVIHDAAFRNKLLAQLEKTPPEGLSRWDCPTLAELLNVSQAAVCVNHHPKVSTHQHRKFSRLMCRVIVFSRLFSLFKPIGIIAGFENIAV
ncbi:MAG: helix-turn-helix domain-containing protein, partial [Methylobacter sp.]